MTQVQVRLDKTKSNSDGDCFGGVNTLFFGDVLQLPVVSNYPLYVRHSRWEKEHEL